MKTLKLFLISGLIFPLVHCTFKAPKLPKEKQISKTDSLSSSYLKKGKEIATQTQKVLGQNLMQAIKSGGPVYALNFCNVQALPLTDSMSNVLDAKIQRVSDQNRNPENIPNTSERAYIEWAKKKIKKQGSAAPKIQKVNGQWTGYYPIMTNPMCLNCHGQPEKDIAPETLAKIDELYPDDQATGYGVNELRGIWVISFTH